MDPKEQLANLPDFIVKPSSSLTYSMIRANPGSTLPLPTNIELFIKMVPIRLWKYR